MDKRVGQRQTNMEVLRVVSMLFIVIGHYLYWGVFGNPMLGNNAFPSDNWLDWCTMEVARLVTTIAVNLYIMITGYFLIDRTTFRWKGIRNVWLQTLFYSVTITIVALFAFGKGFDLTTLLESCLPITMGKYWFVQKYIGLLLLAPFLSRLAMTISKKEYLSLLSIMLVLFIQLPIREPFNSGTVCSLSWFILLYMIAGYYRLHGAPNWLQHHTATIALLILSGLFIGTFCINYFLHGSNMREYTLYSTGTDGLLFFLSVPVFIWFSKQECKGKLCRHISKFAPYTLGIYLIHENRILTSWLWGNLMPQTMFWPEIQILHCIIFSIIVFIICLIIDNCRTFIWPSSLK